MSTSPTPVVLSQYDPNGQYLCYVSVALDKQRISVEPTERSGNFVDVVDGAINENFLLLKESNQVVTALTWCYISSADSTYIAVGLNIGKILLYSPSANEIVHEFVTGNSYEIKDIQVQDNRLWAIDANDYFYEFNLENFELKQHFRVEKCFQLSKLSLLPNDKSKILVASHAIYLIDIEKREVILNFPGHIQPVSQLSFLTNDYFISGAHNDRFLNVYDVNTGATKSVLVAQSDIKEVSHTSQDSIAITTEGGNIELFIDPLVSNTTKRRGNKSKQSTKKISLKCDDKNLPAINVFIKKDILNVAWLENAAIPFFKQLKWEHLSSEHVETVVSGKVKGSQKNRTQFGTDIASAINYREGNATITSGDNFKFVKNAIKEWEEEEELEEKKGENSQGVASFMDEIQGSSISNITDKKKNTSTTVGTVTTILVQALQSNDHSLLETVLNNNDERVLRDTIIRLSPVLTVTLLERLAERIARQTHRQGHLNIWVKWCLIIHGGYLVKIPNLMSSLSSLYSTLKRRSDLLPRLIALDARLDRALTNLSVNEEIIKEEYSYKEDKEDEEFVEYVEELDDAGLLEEESEGDDEESEQDEEDVIVEDAVEDDDLRASGSEEENGYSDVEMGDDVKIRKQR